MIRRLFRLCPQPALLVRLGALHALLAVLQGLMLGLLVPILDAVLRPEPDLAAAAPWLLAGAIGAVVYWALTAIASPVGFAASMELAEQLRLRTMDHVTTLPLGWFTGDRKAQLARVVTTDSGNIGQLAVVIGAPAISATLVPATIVAVAFAVDWRMALLLLAIAPVACVTLRRAGRVAAIADAELEAAATEIAGRAIELGQAQPVLRAAGHGETGGTRMRTALEAHRETYRRGLRSVMVPDLTYTAVVVAGLVAALALDAHLLLSGELALAEAVALLVLAARFLEPLGALIELVGALRAMDNAIARVAALLDTPALPTADDPVRRLGDASVELRDVTFAYGSRPALAGITLRCDPGTTTALVGPSGSGKTTVIRVIARFFDVDAGSVRVGGVDVRQLDPATLLEDVAIVFQDVYLFDDTIEENLRIARPDATRKQLEEAARAARLDEVVARLPGGWQTRVGEAGTQLSGGERQRVSIARAFLKRARIVLIDEAGSALDAENEVAVSEAIADLARDAQRTVIVIAHRPATLAGADRAVALDGGRLVESGSPDALLRSGGAYARLFSQQEQARSWHIA